MKFAIGVLLGLAFSSQSAFASRDPKPIEILHMARVLTSRQPLAFDVHAQPIESDRVEWAALCLAEGPCTVDSHDRISVKDIEGEAAPKLWRPAAVGASRSGRLQGCRRDWAEGGAAGLRCAQCNGCAMKPFSVIGLWLAAALVFAASWLLASEPVKKLYLPTSGDTWVCVRHTEGASCKPASAIRAYILRNAPENEP